MVSKITESVVGVAEYPAAEETMHAMTQAKADLPARQGIGCERRLAIRGSFDIDRQDASLFGSFLSAARNGIFPTNPEIHLGGPTPLLNT